MTSALSENLQSLSWNSFLPVKFEGGPYNAFLSHIAPIALQKLRACAQRKSRNSHTKKRVTHSLGNLAAVAGMF